MKNKNWRDALVDKEAEEGISDSSCGEDDSASSDDGEDAFDEPSWRERRKRIFKTMMLILAVMLLTSLGVGYTMLGERWGPVTSIYVLTQVVTTIGYGDIAVEDPIMKVFVAFYVLACLILFAYFINLGCQSVVEKQVKHLERYLSWQEGKFGIASTVNQNFNIGAINRWAACTLQFLACVAFGTVFYRLYEHCTCSYGQTLKEGCNEADFETCRDTHGYVKEWGDSFYMSVITLTTVGFGDHTPRTRLGRLIGVVWMIIGVASTLQWLEATTSLFFERDTERKLLKAKKLSKKVFRRMDKTKKGYLTRADYTDFLLVKHGLVSQSLIDTIDRHFDMLDLSKENRVTYDMIARMDENMAEMDLS